MSLPAFNINNGYRTRFNTLPVICGVLLVLTGCAINQECADYESYDDFLDELLGNDIRQFEKLLGARAVKSSPRPINRVEYRYDRLFMQPSGQQQVCSTWLEVDKESKLITNWSYDGNCTVAAMCPQHTVLAVIE